jgi:protein gp37
VNKSNIEWCDYTWNPATGCLHGCEYCYARKIAHRYGTPYSGTDNHVITGKVKSYDDAVHTGSFPYEFAPTFHKYRLNEPQKIKKPAKIFVCSMADLFGDWIPDEWINEVMKAIVKAPHHTYMFLTKNPNRYFEYYEGAWQDIPEEYDFSKVRFFLGTSITNQKDINNLSETAKNFIDYLSIEPLQDEIDITDVLYNTPCCCEDPNLKWVIVGAQTGPGAVPPKTEWVQSIIDQCRTASVPVFLKNNLHWPEQIHELPEGLK